MASSSRVMLSPHCEQREHPRIPAARVQSAARWSLLSLLLWKRTELRPFGDDSINHDPPQSPALSILRSARRHRRESQDLLHEHEDENRQDAKDSSHENADPRRPRAPRM